MPHFLQTEHEHTTYVARLTYRQWGRYETPTIELLDPHTGVPTQIAWPLRQLISAGPGALPLPDSSDTLSTTTVRQLLEWARAELLTRAKGSPEILIPDLVGDAIHAAVAHIQDKLGLETNGLSHDWWTPDRCAVLSAVLSEYTTSELQRIGPRIERASDELVLPQQSGDPCPCCHSRLIKQAGQWVHADPDHSCLFADGCRPDPLTQESTIPATIWSVASTGTPQIDLAILPREGGPYGVGSKGAQLIEVDADSDAHREALITGALVRERGWSSGIREPGNPSCYHCIQQDSAAPVSDSMLQILTLPRACDPDEHIGYCPTCGRRIWLGHADTAFLTRLLRATQDAYNTDHIQVKLTRSALGESLATLHANGASGTELLLVIRHLAVSNGPDRAEITSQFVAHEANPSAESASDLGVYPIPVAVTVIGRCFGLQHRNKP